MKVFTRKRWRSSRACLMSSRVDSRAVLVRGKEEVTHSDPLKARQRSLRTSSNFEGERFPITTVPFLRMLSPCCNTSIASRMRPLLVVAARLAASSGVPSIRCGALPAFAFGVRSFAPSSAPLRAVPSGIGPLREVRNENMYTRSSARARRLRRTCCREVVP